MTPSGSPAACAFSAPMSEWLDDEHRDHEQRPDERHRAHPPKGRIAEARPQVEPAGHPQSGRPGERDGPADLRGEPAFDSLEQGPAAPSVGRGACERQHDEGHERDPADPMGDENDMQGARAFDVVKRHGSEGRCDRAASGRAAP